MGDVGEVAKAVTEVTKLVEQKETEKNAPDVRAAAIAQDEQAAQDKTREAIANNDIEEERREAAE